MSELTWLKDFNIDVTEIDRQHQQMFELALAVRQSFCGSDALDTVLGQVDALLEFTAAHFAYEEALMAEHDYPEREQHRRQHRKLLDELANIRSALARGWGLKCAPEIDAADDWVLGHVNGADRKLGRFLNERGVF